MSTSAAPWDPEALPGVSIVTCVLPPENTGTSTICEVRRQSVKSGIAAAGNAWNTHGQGFCNKAREQLPLSRVLAVAIVTALLICSFLNNYPSGGVWYPDCLALDSAWSKSSWVAVIRVSTEANRVSSQDAGTPPVRQPGLEWRGWCGGYDCFRPDRSGWVGNPPVDSGQRQQKRR